VELNLDLGPMDVMDGDRLTVEVLPGPGGRDTGGEPARFIDILGGRPPDWLGAHRPGGAQPWRLWYRIEQVDTSVRE
jgi:hypothetical protein